MPEVDIANGYAMVQTLATCAAGSVTFLNWFCYLISDLYPYLLIIFLFSSVYFCQAHWLCVSELPHSPLYFNIFFINVTWSVCVFFLALIHFFNPQLLPKNGIVIADLPCFPKRVGPMGHYFFSGSYLMEQTPSFHLVCYTGLFFGTSLCRSLPDPNPQFKSFQFQITYNLECIWVSIPQWHFFLEGAGRIKAFFSSQMWGWGGVLMHSWKCDPCNHSISYFFVVQIDWPNCTAGAIPASACSSLSVSTTSVTGWMALPACPYFGKSIDNCYCTVLMDQLTTVKAQAITYNPFRYPQYRNIFVQARNPVLFFTSGSIPPPHLHLWTVLISLQPTSTPCAK